MNKVIILLTATVNPGNMAFTKLIDSALRREQYISSLNYWLKTTDLPIVFIENSGTDLSNEIDKNFSDRVEFLTFNGNNYPAELGKGFGEMKCLQYVSEKSLFYKNSDFVFKVTGRNRVLNFKKIYRHYLQTNDMYIYLDLKRSLSFADSRVFGFNPHFLIEYLLKRQNEVNDSENRFFENSLAKAALDAIIDGRKFEQFSFYPEVTGISGTDNKAYNQSFLFFLAKRIQLFLKADLMKR